MAIIKRKSAAQKCPSDDSKQRHVLNLVRQKLDDSTLLKRTSDFLRHARAAALVNSVAPDCVVMEQIGFTRDASCLKLWGWLSLGAKAY